MKSASHSLAVMVMLMAVSRTDAKQPTVGVPDTTADNCLKSNLSRMTSDRQVTLFKKDGTQITGQLVDVNFSLSRLSIHERYRPDRGYTTFQFSELEKLRFRTKGRLKPGWMLFGLIGGAVIGGIIGNGIDNAGSDSWCGTQYQGVATAVGVIVLGGVGFLAGSIIPLILSSKAVECSFDNQSNK
jgi:hypothetical protein